MIRLLILIALLSLLLVLPFVPYGSFRVVKASPDVFQGDLVLSGNNVTTIENAVFDINGSIFLEGNATLELGGATVNLVQTNHYQHGIFLRNASNGNPHLQSSNSTIASTYGFYVTLQQNSTANFTDSVDSSYFNAFDNSTATISNSDIFFLQVENHAAVTITDSVISYSLSARNGGDSTISITNSTVAWLVIETTSVNCTFADVVPNSFAFWNCQLNSSMNIAPTGSAPNVTLVDTRVDSWQLEFSGTANATLVNSRLKYLHCYGNSGVWLINSTIVSSPQCASQGTAYFSWYLDIRVVDSVGNGVPSAIVSASYENATQAGAQTTNASGWTTMTLMEKAVNATGSYPVGNYTIEAAYALHLNSTSVDMTGSQTIVLALDFIIPEFPSFILLALFTAATLSAVILIRKGRLARFLR